VAQPLQIKNINRIVKAR